MTYDVETYTERGPSTEWDRFVESASGAVNYHRLAWREVIERAFGHPTHYLAARKPDGALAGILPLAHLNSRLFGSFLVSLPFFNYGGVLAQSVSASEALLGGAETLRQTCGAEYVELRGFGRRRGDLPTRNHKVSMLLDLEETEDLQWRGFDAKVRNQVRKALKSGLAVRSGWEEMLEGFYQVFCRNMRDLGTPVYSLEFFRQVLRCLPDSTRIISVERGGQAIASGLITWYRGRVEIPWASSVREFNSLCPNHLLYWEAIRQSIEMGASVFDFGRSTPGEGTFRFKKQWGARPVELHWQYLLADDRPLPDLGPTNPRYRMAIRLWQRLPVPVTRILGPPIVRNIP